jgi:hypothetical protein
MCSGSVAVACRPVRKQRVAHTDRIFSFDVRTMIVPGDAERLPGMTARASLAGTIELFMARQQAIEEWRQRDSVANP